MTWNFIFLFFISALAQYAWNDIDENVSLFF